jgi:hypothetical protein
MLTRRSLSCGVGMSVLHIGLGSAVAAPGNLRVKDSPGLSALASPRPDLRDPAVGDDGTQGNIIGRLWLNTTSGRLWQATDVTAGAAAWSDQGIPSPYPGDTGTWDAVLGTKPLTSAYASGTKPFVDVYTIDKDLKPAGPFTINFIDGAIDTATIRALSAANPVTSGMPEDKMCVLRPLLVGRWYDQSGNNRHFTQSFAAFMPTLWLIDGAADGTGESSVRIAFSRNSPLTGYRPCDRHLVSATGGLNTRSATVYAVCQPHEASNDNSDPGLLGTSLDINGIQIGTAAISVGATTWRLVNRDAWIDTAATPFSTSPTVLSVSLGAKGVELATNDDISNLAALPNATGTGFVIGAGYKSWNSGAPAAGTGAYGFYGVIDAVLAKATADNAGTTKSVRRSLHRAFNVVPQSANDTVVIEGDSGTVSWGSVFPLVPYSLSSNFHLADVGIDGYGLNWMNQRKLSRWVRYVQLGRVGCGWLDPSTDTHLSSFYNRLPALRAQYNPSAKRNICVIGSHGMGLADSDPGTAPATYSLMVSWLSALRAGGQSWTVVLGLMSGGIPGGGFEAFNQLIISNASALDVSYFTELTSAQISAVERAPKQLANLYDWKETNGRYNGHLSPLGYAAESQAWAAAINAVL